MLANCKYFRILSKLFSASPPKDIKISLLESYGRYTIQLDTTGKPVFSYLTSTVDKTHHGPIITPFSAKILKYLQQFLAMPEVS